MATILGKRRRPIAQVDPSDESDYLTHQSTYQEALRKHFETAFEPVEIVATTTSSHTGTGSHENYSGSDIGDRDDDSDWDGLSEDEDVQIVSYGTTTLLQEDEDIIKSQRKSFMSSKPPATEQKAVTSKNQTQASLIKEATNAFSLTSEDLALQRLLSESHLLTGTTRSTLLPTLKARQSAQDLRLRSLGAKKSVDALGAGNTPMAVRKGIETKKDSRERNRRQHAREAGIVLEREDRSSADKDKRRKRAIDVGAPAVGRWKGGTLTLGKQDVAEIRGQRLSSDFGKKSRGGKKRKRH